MTATVKITQLKYKRVEIEIRRLADTLPVGAKLPSERDMAVAYRCNFLTVRKALESLVEDGTVVRRVGSGTFIARHQGADLIRGDEKKRVGILVYQGSNDYAYRLLQGVAHASLQQGIDLRSAWVRDFVEQAMVQAEQFARDGCVALTLPWFPHELTDEVRAFLRRSPLPVSLAMVIPGFENNCFLEPGMFGMSHATEDLCAYFASMGHRRIAFIGPDSANDTILQRRLTTYVCYTSRENLPSPCGLVAAGAEAMDQLALRWKPYQGELAIISYDDEHALRFMTSMHKIGLKAPDDFCIVGYNDTEASRYSDPPLSTVHQDFDYIGHWLLKNALALEKGTVAQARKIPRLQMLVRSTCGGRNHAGELAEFRFTDMDIVPNKETAPAVALPRNGATADSAGTEPSRKQLNPVAGFQPPLSVRDRAAEIVAAPQ